MFLMNKKNINKEDDTRVNRIIELKIYFEILVKSININEFISKKATYEEKLTVKIVKNNSIFCNILYLLFIFLILCKKLFCGYINKPFSMLIII